MVSEKAPKRRKRKIRKRNNTELELLQQKLLELIRSKAIQEIASDDGSGTPEEQMKAINAGYRFLCGLMVLTETR